MRLTYGDLSETELDFEPLSLIRAVVEYACDVMRGAQRVEHRRAAQSRAGAQVVAWSQEAADLRARLRSLVATEVAPGDLLDDIEHSLGDAIDRQTARRRDAANREQQRLDEEIAYERERCLEALAPLLCGFSLPDTRARLRLRNDSPGYRAELATRTDLAGAELRAQFALDVGASFASGNRKVRSFAREAQLRVPARGWFGRRKVKLRDLSECVLQAVDHSAHGTVAVLRAAGRRPIEYRLERNDDGLYISAQDGRAIGTVAPVGADARAADQLLDALTVAAVPLAERRSQLIAAQLSGTDVTELCDVELVALQLIDSLAPLVRELWDRSPGDDELVIGVPGADGTVDTRALALSTLRDALAPLDANQRGMFSSWGLPLAGAPLIRTDAPGAGRLARGSTPPPPARDSDERPPATARPTTQRPSTVDLDSGWA